MFKTSGPWQLLIVATVGWISRDQQTIISYLQEEYRVLREDQDAAINESLTAIYPATEGVQQGRLRNLTDQALHRMQQAPPVELLPANVLQKLQMPPLAEAIVYLAHAVNNGAATFLFYLAGDSAGTALEPERDAPMLLLLGVMVAGAVVLLPTLRVLDRLAPRPSGKNPERLDSTQPIALRPDSGVRQDAVLRGVEGSKECHHRRLGPR